MDYKVRFIYANSYDFVDDSGKRVVGTNLICFDGKGIVKVKAESNYKQLKFGDSIDVTADIKGNRIKFVY